MAEKSPTPDGLAVAPNGAGDINNPPANDQELQAHRSWGRWTTSAFLPNAASNAATGAAYAKMRPGDEAYVESTSSSHILDDRGTSGGANAVWTQSGGGGLPWFEDESTPTIGQVTFILSTAPTDALSLTMRVNGAAYDNGIDYTVSGVTVTWLNLDFTMETTDKVHLRYQ